jgi:hypothetical protein
MEYGLVWRMKLIHLQQENQIQIQKAAVKNVLQQLDADVYTVQEISDDILFAQMVSEMNDYSYVYQRLAHPNDLLDPNKKVYL